ncbi:GNAT family N-acetyltransferase [Halobacillus sp. A5]|uniref:GNAT family N-acetyltransferase n=1 Tax=Halobacillus sp. A5 TaxID=2880263 RepID=UPI0020A68B9B|nr:GNAT family N-acetyltransferase [Halobacillus sp. A5]MCP3029028.1 GNAT family N-acetyltransferase [Halobacillus sp. A5]
MDSSFSIRSFQAKDFDAILELNSQEGWEQLAANKDETFHGWINSEPALVLTNNDEVVGYLRGLTDGSVSLFVCELLIRRDYRGQNLGKILIEEAHSCYPSTRVEVLATSESEGYYSQQSFRPFYGFRKAAEEFV